MAKKNSIYKRNKLLTVNKNLFAGGGDSNASSIGGGGSGLFGSIGKIGMQAAKDISTMMNNINASDIRDTVRNLEEEAKSSQIGEQVSSDTFDTLATDMAKTSQIQHISPKQLRVKNFGQIWKDSFVAGNEGFAAGSSMGPWGALGAAVGSTVTSITGNLFRNNKVRREARRLNKLIDYTNEFNDRSLSNRASNLENSRLASLEANYIALGGNLNSGGRIYIKPENKGKFTATKKRTGKTTEELTHSNNPLTRKRAIFAQNAKKWHHAFGGELNTQGGDFTNGMIYIDNGGTHEENPFEGVPMGFDNEGVPNLVEEGETIFNDYVFSNRIPVPKAIREKYKLRGAKDLTFAEASKKLAKESEERPNDPISINGLEALMSDLAMEQELIKAKNREDNKFSYGGKVNKFDGDSTMSNMIRRNTNASQEDYWSALVGKQLISKLQELNALSGDEREAAIDNFIAQNNSLQDSYYNNIYNSGATWGGRTVRGGKDHQVAWNNAGYNNYTDYDNWFGNRNITNDRADSWVDNNIGDLTLLRNLGDKRVLSEDTLQQIRQLSSQLGLTYEEKGDGNTLMYFKRGISPISGLDSKKFVDKAEVKKKTSPIIKNTYKDEGDKGMDYLPTGLRYAPAVGLGLATLSDALGITNKPDYSNADTILRTVRNLDYDPVRFNPIGNYLEYNPFDREFYINQLNAQSGATRRAILQNAGLNRGAGMAAILAADNNAQNQLGNLARQAEEYNLAQRQRVEEFNRGTNQINSQGFLQADTANQGARARTQELGLKGLLAASEMRERAKLASDQAKSANLSGFIQSLGDIGRENMAWNWRNFGLDTGSFGPVDETTEELLTNTKRKKAKKPKKEAYGGKIRRRKKGLTY